MGLKELDLLFIHPPAILGESHSILGADVAYSHQFVSFPMGFFSMSNNLETAGFNVKIINLGERMLVKKSEETLEDLVLNVFSEYSPKIVGIDIHWWVHSAGAVETARLIKRHCPRTKIFVGGITASLYVDEILNKYEYIDYITFGECEESIVEFIKEICKESPCLSEVPNLAYRNGDTILKTSVQIPNIENGSVDVTRYDLLADKPIVNPDRALIPIERGCTQKCCYCGASKKSFEFIMHRPKMCMLNPHNVVDMIKKNMENGRRKIYLYGDIRDGGREYVNTFFKLLNKSQITKIHIVIELFYPPSEEYIRNWKVWAENTENTIEATFSPESANEKVRLHVGKNYSNEVMLDSCKLVIESGIPVSIYFMLGFPEETNETVEQTLQLSEKIVEMYAARFKKEDLRHEIVGYEFMQMPDPGSSVHLDPDKYGYTLHFRGFEGLVNMVNSAKHWSELVGYSTAYFTKDELVEKYYYIKERIYKIYKKFNLISDEDFNENMKILKEDRSYLCKV